MGEDSVSGYALLPAIYPFWAGSAKLHLEGASMSWQVNAFLLVYRVISKRTQIPNVQFAEILFIPYIGDGGLYMRECLFSGSVLAPLISVVSVARMDIFFCVAQVCIIPDFKSAIYLAKPKKYTRDKEKN